MAGSIVIPGRRITNGETFYTDWVPRGGDCILLRAEALIKSSGASGSVNVTLETRGEDGTSVEPVTATTTAVALNGVGIQTCLYLASTATTAGNGAQEQVRVKVAYTDGSSGNYYVIRVFPLIYFDSAKPY